jgi:hypothetical protein
MVALLCLALTAGAQLRDERMDTKDRVLDILFQSDAPASPFLTKMTLRFADTGTQFVVLTYPVYPAHPGGRAEIISYSIAGTSNGKLSEIIARMVSQDSNVTAREIANRLKVNVTRIPINFDALENLMKDLRAVRISPVLKTRVAVDDYSKYDFWYDNGEEFVHYSMVGPFRDAAQDQLVQWMIRFRANLPGLTKVTSTPGP